MKNGRRAPRSVVGHGVLGAWLTLVVSSCSSAELSCGPSRAVVARVIDGDTIELASGERVRYLLVDTPEISTGQECFGPQARDYNRSLVENREVTLTYDSPCHDRYGRSLAYVSVAGRDVNALLVQQGFGCALHIPPAGNTRAAEFQALERQAKQGGLGLWSACESKPCG